MRFVLAIVSFVLAAVLIGLGVGQRTIWASPDEVVRTVSVDEPTAVTIVDGTALNAFEGKQSLSFSGSDTVFAAYGRTTDVTAWVGDAEHTRVTFDDETGELVQQVVAGEETTVPNPNGSDLWLENFTEENTLDLTVDIPSDVSILLASDGEAPAPSDISMSWPLDNSTPFSGPLIIGGGIMLLIGLGMLVWAINHLRASRGPRRKSPKMPKLPRQPRYKPGRRQNERPVTGRRGSVRGFVAIPAVLAGALLLSACTTGASTSSATPVPTAETTAAVVEPTTQPPAATVRQVERIVSRIGSVVAEADAALDTELIASRMSGPALELRLADYAIRGADGTIPSQVPAIPEGPVEVVLPQQTAEWPRTVFAVIQDPTNETTPPVALFLVQDGPRDNYMVNYAVTLEPAAELPPVASATIGANQLLPETGVLKLQPQTLAASYGDILAKDVESESYLDFEAEGDTLRLAVGLQAKQTAAAELPATASVAFANAPGVGETIALSTDDSGALVAVNLTETTTVTPVEEGAAVNPSGAVKVLSGLTESTTGVAATYGDQLLFYVPPADSDGKIILLGYSQGLVTAKEI